MKRKCAIIKAIWGNLIYDQRVFISLVVLFALLNMITLFTEMVVVELKSSINKVRSNLGADLIIVSCKYDSDTKNALFLGTPSTVCFDSNMIDNVLNIDEVEAYSSNLFVSSLDSDCCEEKVEFIIYDESDFVLDSMLAEFNPGIDRRNIIIGSDVEYEVGEAVTFFGCVFHVAGKLNKTGMGYDECIFADQKCGESISRFLDMDSFYGKASMILIKKTMESDIDYVYEKINHDIENYGLVAYKTPDLFSEVEESVKTINGFAIVTLIFLLVIGITAIIVIVIMDFENNKKNVAILKVIGLSDKSITKLFLLKNAMITSISAIIGNITGGIFLVLFREHISTLFQIQFSIDIIIVFRICLNIATSITTILIISGIVRRISLPKDYNYKKGIA